MVPSPVSRHAGAADKCEIGRFGIHWDEIDEDIELAGLLVGAKAPDAKPPVEA